MRFSSFRVPTFLFALAPLAGCLGAADTGVEQDSAGLSRDRDVSVDRERGDLDRTVDGDRFQRCVRDWECRPGDFCLAPDGDDRGDRPDVRYCGREPDYACDGDRACGRGAECVRGNCVRLVDDKDECRNGRYFRSVAQRIQDAVADGSLRPAAARDLWRRLANAVEDQCGDGRDDVRDDGSRDDGSRDPDRRDGGR